ncbi:MAG: hypothetical protein RMM58_06690 [Chloroflexota bacterium]|nr:hypothetical protein [Dehalococcoidia bacterium]MDW8253548.1 hypothetical protein [Chloroflexota bacterium]
MSPFGHELRLEIFSVHQALEAALARIDEARAKIRADRKTRKRRALKESDAP